MLLTVLLWSLLPAGVMPTAGADGGVKLVLCTGDGPLTVTLAPDGTPRPVLPDDSDRQARQQCPWAAAQAVSAIAPTSFSPFVRVATATRRRRPALAALPHPARPRPRQQPRAPPTLL